MSQLYTLPFGLLFFFLALGMGSFVFGCLLFYYVLPLQEFQNKKRKCLEGMGLVLLLSYFMIPYEALYQVSTGILPLHLHEPLRYAIGGGSLVSALWNRKQEGRSGYLLGAAFLSLPVWDVWMPLPWIGGMVLLDARMARLFPSTYRQYHEKITLYSIQAAVDTLDEGILLCTTKGQPLLVNQTMQQVMQDILQTRVRNGNIFWHLLQNGGPKGATMERMGQKLLYRLADGKVWLFSRVPVADYDSELWQISADDVTELEARNRELVEKNQLLAKRNEKMKDLLSHLVDIQSRETIQDIRSRMHDLMGQRISLLQQVLNNKDFSNYGSLSPLLRNVLTDLEKDIEVDVSSLLSELVDTYAGLGIYVDVNGVLPARKDVARCFVEIIREAMTNAICHGHANRISISFVQKEHYSLEIQDNGVGCVLPIRPGGGLSSMEKKVKDLGGTIAFQNQPHFGIRIEIVAGC